ncbi:MFS transporter permease [Klebsiella pneumoniae]|uniref:MFS transporter permease n=1 Tax=Klebsiella pneumoniae TaxID=573 RepID=A0A2X3FA55_KLEPN|nr:MFS transporter permease [Klebsiella pneumoniae]
MHFTTPLPVIAAMSFSTFMWGTGAPNIFALLAKATHPRVSATAGGIFNGLGNFAGALSPAVMGALIAFTHSMDSGLIFSGGDGGGGLRPVTAAAETLLRIKR